MPVTFGHLLAFMIAVALFIGLGTSRFYADQRTRRLEARARMIERAPAQVHTQLQP